jgi:hypothetical protein
MARALRHERTAPGVDAASFARESGHVHRKTCPGRFDRHANDLPNAIRRQGARVPLLRRNSPAVTFGTWLASQACDGCSILSRPASTGQSQHAAPRDIR